MPTVVELPIVPADEVDVSPMARQRDLPRYTRRARRLQQEGIVNLRIHIDSNGEVSDVTLLSGIPDSDLNEAALEATRELDLLSGAPEWPAGGGQQGRRFRVHGPTGPNDQREDSRIAR